MHLPRLPRQNWCPGDQQWEGSSLELVCKLQGTALDLRHLLAQVDEEAALEQAVKFCQVHLGAATQRQVSFPQPVLALLCRICSALRPQATSKEVGTPQAGTVPVVSGW